MDSDQLGQLVADSMLHGLLVGAGAMLHAAFVTSPVGWIVLGILLLIALIPAGKRRRRYR
ncbi:hypothetical protein [Schumannella sp. 10F1B-5-1]|uniref:hypothetical protein n=1 Tax=Schumannella sp. 10F1B-5-1 TaxID=2590780 RepID=UPI001130B921|nr:hypothetical protein [Schumannella sp. 10F1B-5-1]TPW70907.1 hypothetical protein FJ658_12435 [Schumannella sp. 10F1B-5-1]